MEGNFISKSKFMGVTSLPFLWIGGWSLAVSYRFIWIQLPYSGTRARHSIGTKARGMFISFIKDILKVFLSFIKDLLKGLFFIKGLLKGLLSFIKGIFKGFRTFIKGLLEGFVIYVDKGFSRLQARHHQRRHLPGAKIQWIPTKYEMHSDHLMKLHVKIQFRYVYSQHVCLLTNGKRIYWCLYGWWTVGCKDSSIWTHVPMESVLKLSRKRAEIPEPFLIYIKHQLLDSWGIIMGQSN